MIVPKTILDSFNTSDLIRYFHGSITASITPSLLELNICVICAAIWIRSPGKETCCSDTGTLKLVHVSLETQFCGGDGRFKHRFYLYQPSILRHLGRP